MQEPITAFALTILEVRWSGKSCLHLYLDPANNLNNTSVSAPLLHIENDSPAVQYLTYYVTTAFKTNPGCFSKDSVTIQVYAPPNVNFIMPEICLTDAKAQFYDSTTYNDSTMLPFTYTWSFGDPNAISRQSQQFVLANPFHIYSAASYYPLTLAVTNSKGCVSTKSKTFTVNGAVPLAALNVRAALITMQQPAGEHQQMKARSILAPLPGSRSTGAIQPENLETDESPFPGKIYSHLYPNPVTTNNAGYTIRMISYSGISC